MMSTELKSSIMFSRVFFLTQIKKSEWGLLYFVVKHHSKLSKKFLIPAMYISLESWIQEL